MYRANARSSKNNASPRLLIDLKTKTKKKQKKREQPPKPTKNIENVKTGIK